MTNAAMIMKGFVDQQILKAQLLKPRRHGTSISIPNHDRQQELVIGDNRGDVSYAIVSTSVDYTPPDD
ncbi:hypothetical protein [Rhizobium ruizarguesonis]|uniref:hypothetical protein n=1 Tax=Rhizobium ruizarguesonis TaxID=2081791 RepID=UPI0010321B0C|nr:hypothetical protein [Rhizobium ruizarguesonis]TAV14721.1 hypothetical protein ELI34_04225 [Rhizobium ruizarguesonis]